jgi:hypothetical protein
MLTKFEKMGLNKNILFSATTAGLVALSGCNNMSKMVKMAEDQEVKSILHL